MYDINNEKKMCPKDQIDFESIQRIFIERDRRELAKRQQEGASQISLRACSGGSGLERVPLGDEFHNSRTPKKPSKGALARRKKAAKRNAVKRYSTRRPVHKNKLNAKGKAALATTTVALFASAVGMIFASANNNNNNNKTQTGGNNIPIAGFSAEYDAPFTPDIFEEGLLIGNTQYSFESEAAPTEIIPTEEASLVETEVEETEPKKELPPLFDASEIGHVSDRMVDALKGWESLYLETYVCPGKKLTIGYGHTADVKEGMKITEKQAEKFLKEDLVEHEGYVKTYAKRLDLKMSQADFDALVSLSYNIGSGALWKSGIMQKLAKDDRQGACDLINKYVYAGGEIRGGLVKRREVEASWILEGME